jgi:hypothetical protein
VGFKLYGEARWYGIRRHPGAPGEDFVPAPLLQWVPPAPRWGHMRPFVQIDPTGRASRATTTNVFYCGFGVFLCRRAQQIDSSSLRRPMSSKSFCDASQIKKPIVWKRSQNNRCDKRRGHSDEASEFCYVTASRFKKRDIVSVERPLVGCVNAGQSPINCEQWIPDIGSWKRATPPGFNTGSISPTKRGMARWWLPRTTSKDRSGNCK